MQINLQILFKMAKNGITKGQKKDNTIKGSREAAFD